MKLIIIEDIERQRGDSKQAHSSGNRSIVFCLAVGTPADVSDDALFLSLRVNLSESWRHV